MGINLQKIFDTAWQAFIIERKPPAQEYCGDGIWRCRYKTSDGRKCAIGLVIPDGHPYQAEDTDFARLLFFEKHNVFNRPRIFDDKLIEMLDNPRLSAEVCHLQSELHDSLINRGVWRYDKEIMKEMYREVAQVWNLTVPE